MSGEEECFFWEYSIGSGEKIRNRFNQSERSVKTSHGNIPLDKTFKF